MEDQFPRRKGLRALLALFFACALSVPVWLPDDVDLWWLLATGRWIVENKAFPRVDPFSFTARGAPWALHEWLFGLLAYGVEWAGGSAGLVAAELAIVVLIFASILAVRRSLGTSLLATVFFSFAALMSMRTRITLRPELISLLFFGWTLAALEMRDRGRRWPAFCLPPLFAVWANLHSGCIYGLAAIFLWAVGSWMGGRRTVPPGDGQGKAVPSSRDERGRIVGLLAACLLATFLNPLGPGALTYPLRLLFDPFMRGLRIEELQRTPFSLNYLDVWVLAALASGTLALSVRRVRLREALILALTGYLAFAHIRSIGLFAVACAWFLPPLVDDPRLVARVERRAPAVGKTFLPILAVALALVSATALGRRLVSRDERLDSLFPLRAASFIEREGLAGPIYNAQEWGGWLIWRFYGVRPVYFDGRNDVFLHAFDGTRGFRDPENLERFGIRAGLIPVEGGEARSLFSDRSRWGLVYWDDLSAVFVRRSPENVHLLDRFEYRVVRPYLGEAGIAALGDAGRRTAAEELSRKLGEDAECHLARRLREAAMLRRDIAGGG